MSEKMDSEGRNLDWIKWIAAAALVGGGIYLNSYFSAESLLLRTIGLLFVAGAAGWTSAKTEKGGAFIDLCLEAWVEIRKVVWPSRQ
jgi:preprotein translocase subunit SecE